VRFIADGRIEAALPLGEIGAWLRPYPHQFIFEQSRRAHPK
jgi:hypothetical protein